jgi:hypothetical protein
MTDLPDLFSFLICAFIYLCTQCEYILDTISYKTCNGASNVQFLAGEGNNSPATRPELTTQRPTFMYVTCILYIVFISTNNVNIFYLTIFVL